ncbi:abscisate beta-glucosyltransferase-like [Andrographis paniculata]|uniref:abscisate beta-glucosyltransferase-like n=1 Tax=Andrographis paniculata TaxID=175694 RepID=UPI0021E77DA5|nr:abscisate beta-glucosyltransferase-like [Andrographis paniculata]
MASPTPPLQIYFFPFVGGGHFIPMIDLARLFAAHGAAATILAAPNDVVTFQNSIQRDHQQSGLPISLHPLLQNSDLSASPFTDTSALHDPLRRLLLHRPPDCIIADTFHRWASDLIDDLQIPRIVFNGGCCFSRCCEHSITSHSPHTKVDSDSDHFTLPGLPDTIQLCRSQLPIFVRTAGDFPGKLRKSDENSLGQVINSFHYLEPSYVDYYKNVMGKKAWLVGPVSLYNKNVQDKFERGQRAAIDEQTCLNWLDSKNPNSVLYVSFGSLARLSKAQIFEIAAGLENSGHPFVWAIGKILEDDDDEGRCFPDGFEKRVLDSEQGLVIKGWAPQLLILEHGAVGGFMTHCGWNSTLEGVCAAVPMITWPLSAEQFYNEKLVTEVLGIGVGVGSVEWGSWNMEGRAVVGREEVRAAVGRLMGGDAAAEEMRRRVEVLAVEAKKAVEEGGSSFRGVDDLIEDLRSYKKKQNSE